jgi:glycosyltransferase involved in cell wall biosynthesis
MGSVCNCPLPSVPANLHLLGVLGEAEKGCLMAGVDLALNPMESGSGTNLKMLEYAAAGILIVSSVFGNRGLRFVDGEHVLISATEDFPDSINMVLRNGLHYYAPIIARARKLVEDHYSWQAVARKLEIKPWQ